jgi:hypothetical protein
LQQWPASSETQHSTQQNRPGVLRNVSVCHRGLFQHRWSPARIRRPATMETASDGVERSIKPQVPIRATRTPLTRGRP